MTRSTRVSHSVVVAAGVQQRFVLPTGVVGRAGLALVRPLVSLGMTRGLARFAALVSSGQIGSGRAPWCVGSPESHAMGDNAGSGPERGRWPMERGSQMAAMKPRTGDGPLEVTKEGRGIVMRVPLEGGGRLVVELSADEARDLGSQLSEVAG